jgi:Immunoglobulin-like domain of bacterial spore germination
VAELYTKRYMIKAMYFFLAIALIAGVARYFVSQDAGILEPVACTMDAMMCPDGSYVGRTGPKCEFVCPAAPEVPADVAAEIAAKADLITLSTPLPNGVVMSPLTVAGSARGNWFFEGSFPITLTNWDGLIIAEGIATAEGDWMTTDFVPFSASLEFTNPYQTGGQDFMKRGSLILKKDNPSGLPEHDAALEIPVHFAP